MIKVNKIPRKQPITAIQIGINKAKKCLRVNFITQIGLLVFP